MAPILTSFSRSVVNDQCSTSFGKASVLHQAAIDGQGVALESESIVRADLEAGRLVKPFDVDLDRDNAYYLVAPPRHFDRPNVQAFRDFLLSELAAETGGPQAV